MADSHRVADELAAVGAEPGTLCALLSGADLAAAENIVGVPRHPVVVAAGELCARLAAADVPRCAGCGAEMSRVGAAAVWHGTRLLCALHCAAHVPCRAAAFDGLDSVIFLLNRTPLSPPKRRWTTPSAVLVPHAAYVAALRNRTCGASTRWALVLAHSALQCVATYFPERAFADRAFDALPADARRCVRPDCGASLTRYSAGRVMSALRRDGRVWQVQIYVHCAAAAECRAAALDAQCRAAPETCGTVEYSLAVCDACGRMSRKPTRCVRCGVAAFCDAKCERAHAKYHVDQCAHSLLAVDDAARRARAMRCDAQSGASRVKPMR